MSRDPVRPLAAAASEDGPEPHEGPVPCLHGMPLAGGPGGPAARWLDGRATPLPAVGDAEGPRLPSSLPPVIDAHVHLFPERVFAAIWRWFGQHGWPIRYPLPTPQVIDFLLSRGVERVVALHYSHAPGMARELNRYVAGICAEHPRVTGLATVLPGEPEALEVLREAHALGLAGVKLHCHVQRFSPDAPELEPLYAFCSEKRWPMVMHAGREPSSRAYPVDPYALCNVTRTERVLRAFPDLQLCVPHLGADEFEGSGRLLERHDGLWLDTTMTLASYFPVEPPRRLFEVRPERILYGTDFPNIPYAWDRELKGLLALRLPEDTLHRVLGANARALYGLPPAAGADLTSDA